MLLRDALDLLARCVFFATAPFVLVFLALLFPVTGAVIQIALALVVFFAGEAIRRSALRWPVLPWILASQFEFEAFYRDNPPRPFAYYVLYPLLWIAIDELGSVINDEKQLPANAFTAMRRAAR